MKATTYIWLIFSLLFLSLGGFHFYESTQKIPIFEAKPSSGIGKIEGVSIAKSGFSKFIPEFNTHIEKQNLSSKRQNLLAMMGYILAAMTAGVSAILSIDKYEKWAEKILKKKPR